MANYIEIIPYSSNVDSIVYNIELSEDDFYKKLEIFKQKNYSKSVKEYKEYRYHDIIYQKYSDESVKVFRDNTLHVEESKKYITIHYKRDVVSLLQYPSTTDITYKQYVKRVSFKITHKLFVNFEISLEKDQEKVYTVYMNFNKDLQNQDKLSDVPQFNQLLETIC